MKVVTKSWSASLPHFRTSGVRPLVGQSSHKASSWYPRANDYIFSIDIICWCIYNYFIVATCSVSGTVVPVQYVPSTESLYNVSCDECVEKGRGNVCRPHVMPAVQYVQHEDWWWARWFTTVWIIQKRHKLSVVISAFCTSGRLNVLAVPFGQICLLSRSRWSADVTNQLHLGHKSMRAFSSLFTQCMGLLYCIVHN